VTRNPTEKKRIPVRYIHWDLLSMEIIVDTIIICCDIDVW
jgi:hypothetical protein